MSQPFKLSDLPAHVLKLNPHLTGAPLVVVKPRKLGEATVNEMLAEHAFRKISQASPLADFMQPAKKRVRQHEGDGMNSWERKYRAELAMAYPDRTIHREVSLPLANGLRYKVDFLVGKPGETPMGFEVKGQARAAGIAKLKMAATLYPWITFKLVTKKRKKDGGGWDIQNILP